MHYQAGGATSPSKGWELRHREAAARSGKAFETVDACPGEVSISWGTLSSHTTMVFTEKKLR